MKESQCFWLAVVGAAMVLPVTLLMPLGFDNDVYESMAWTLYAYHGLPYLASWDMNFPGIVFVHWASIALFGASDFGFRLFDYCVQIGFAALYFRLLRRWLTPAESLTAVIVSALVYTRGTWGMYGQRDVFAVCILVAAAIVLFRMRERGVRVWGAAALGMLSSSAILFRPTYGLFAITLLLLLRDVNTHWKYSVSYMLGCLLLWTVVLLPYALTNGGLSQFFYSTISFNFDVYARIKVGNGVFSISNAAFWLFAVLGIVLPKQRRSGPDMRPIGRFDKKFFILYSASAIISPVVMGKYFTYHLLAAQTIILALASVGFLKVVSYSPWPHLRRAVIALSFVLMVVVMYPRQLVRHYLEGITSGSPVHYAYAKVLSDSLFGLDAQEAVVRFINPRVLPNEKVEYATVYPGLKWRLRHPTATKFTTLMPLARTAGGRPG